MPAQPPVAKQVLEDTQDLHPTHLNSRAWSMLQSQGPMRPTIFGRDRAQSRALAQRRQPQRSVRPPPAWTGGHGTEP